MPQHHSPQVSFLSHWHWRPSWTRPIGVLQANPRSLFSPCGLAPCSIALFDLEARWRVGRVREFGAGEASWIESRGKSPGHVCPGPEIVSSGSQDPPNGGHQRAGVDGQGKVGTVLRDRPRRLARSRTSGFHPDNTGSNPVGVIPEVYEVLAGAVRCGISRTCGRSTPHLLPPRTVVRTHLFCRVFVVK